MELLEDVWKELLENFFRGEVTLGNPGRNYLRNKENLVESREELQDESPNCFISLQHNNQWKSWRNT